MLGQMHVLAQVQGDRCFLSDKGALIYLLI